MSQVNLVLSGEDAEIFIISPVKITNFQPGETRTITIKTSVTDPRRSITYKTDLLVGNIVDSIVANGMEKISIIYHICSMFTNEDIKMDKSNLREGITAQFQTDLSSEDPQACGNWMSLNPAIAAVNKDGTLTAVSPGKTVVGYMVPDGGGFKIMGTEITILPAVMAETVNTELDTGANRVNLSFSEPVSASGAITGLTAAIFSSPVNITNAVFSDSQNISLTLDKTIEFGDRAFIMYSSGNLSDSGGEGLKNFTAQVTNNIVVNTLTNKTRPYSGVTVSDSSSNITRAVDGDLSTRWEAGSATKACIINLTYASAISVKRAVLVPFQTRITGFKLEYSTNSVDWKELYIHDGPIVEGAKVTNMGGGNFSVSDETAFSFQSVSARYFRLNITGAVKSPSLYELELWGE